MKSILIFLTIFLIIRRSQSGRPGKRPRPQKNKDQDHFCSGFTEANLEGDISERKYCGDDFANEINLFTSRLEGDFTRFEGSLQLVLKVQESGDEVNSILNGCYDPRTSLNQIRNTSGRKTIYLMSFEGCGVHLQEFLICLSKKMKIYVKNPATFEMAASSSLSPCKH